MGDKGSGYGERGGGWNMRGEKTGEEKKKTVVRMDCMGEKSIFNFKKKKKKRRKFTPISFGAGQYLQLNLC